MKKIVMVIVILILAGCATGIQPNRATVTQTNRVTQPNRIIVILSSEPPGAKVYEVGKYLGTTPHRLSYVLDNMNYDAGVMLGRKIDILYPGAYPEEYNPVLKVNPMYRPDPTNWKTGGKYIQHYELVIFKTPSNITPVPIQAGAPSNITSVQAQPGSITSVPIQTGGNQNITIHRKKDSLDTLNSGLDALFKLNALPQTRMYRTPSRD